MKWLFLILGLFFVGLGFIGVFLPGLPTTPFLLLAAACFARSSRRMYRWLLSNRLFGPMIKNWQETRSITRKTKMVAIGSTVLMGGISAIFIIDHMALQWLVIALILMSVFIIARLRETESLQTQEINKGP